MIEVVCLQCGITFLKEGWRVNRSPNHYCSRECSALGHRKQWACIGCGTLLDAYGRTGRRLKRHLCDDCRRGWRRKYDYETRSCLHCGTEFEVVLSKKNNRFTQKFCSHKCSTDYRDYASGPDHCRYNSIEISCQTCGNSFTVQAYRQTTAKFCSRACQRHPQISALEEQTAAELERRGLLYDRQIKLKPFTPDFLVGQTMIEVDGDYWHLMPEVAEKDKRKDLFYREHGFDVIHIWGHEIRDNDFSKLDVLVSPTAPVI